MLQTENGRLGGGQWAPDPALRQASHVTGKRDPTVV